MSVLAVIVPVYNEVDRIAQFTTTWTAALTEAAIDFTLCVYDDGSRDGSGEALAAIARTDPRISVRRHDNRGHGPTVTRGYLEHLETPWILQLDADDTIGPALAMSWWPMRESFDLMMATRHDPQRSGFRRALSVLARTAVRVLFGRGIRDVNAPYRLIRTAACRPALAALPADTLLPNVFLAGYACRAGLRIRQEPVSVRGRLRRETVLSQLRWVHLALRGCAQLVALTRRRRA